jgi:hypothetical protein
MPAGKSHGNSLLFHSLVPLWNCCLRLPPRLLAVSITIERHRRFRPQDSVKKGAVSTYKYYILYGTESDPR